MSLKYRLPLVFFFTFFLLFFSVHAHGPSPAHARRSLAFKKKLHRQLDIPGALGDIVGDVGDLLGNTGSTPPGPSSTSTTSSDTTSPPTTDPANTDPPSTTTPPSSDPPSTTPPPSTSPPPSTDTSASTPSTTSSGISSSPLSSSTPSPDGSSCLLGLDLFGNCVLSVSSSASSQTTDSLSSPPTDPPTSQTTSTSSSPPASSPDTPTLTPTPTPTPTPDCPLGLVINGECVLPSSSSSTPPPTPTPTPDCPLGLVIDGECVLPSSSSSTPPPSASSPSLTSEPPPSIPLPSITPDPDSSSSPPTTNPGSPTPTPSSSPPVDPCGSVGQLLGLCSSNSSPPASTPSLTPTSQISPSVNPPDSSTQSAPSPTSTPYQPVEPCGSLGIDLGLCTSLPSSATTPQASPQPTGSSSSPPGSSLSSSFSPPALPTGSSVFTISPSESCGPLGLCGSTTTSDSGTTVPSSPPGTQSQPSPSGQSDSSQSGSSPTTSFPSGIPTSWSGTVSSSMSGSGNGTSLSSPPVIAFPSTNDTVSSTTSFSSTPTSGPSFPSFTPPPQGQLSYVTQASLLGTPVPSSSPVTLSDPDGVPPTLTIASPSNLPSTTTPVLLPSNLPARIYPPTQVDPNSLSGFSLVSILFDQFLSWSFVAQNTQSQGQLFLWLPTIIQSALGLPSEQVKTFALQVFLPATYNGPADVDMLQTTFLLYIPSGQVAVLANQIKVISSPFYTSLGEPYKTLASHVNPAYSLTSVQDPNAVPGTGTTSSVNSSGNKSRTDAIIGVASALGGLALAVLGVLIYRSVKRSRDLSHRRLSDPNAPNDPYPDRTGRDFDQDSVGGQRRRSFYFAEDSLRGQQTVQQTAVPVAQPQHEVSQVEYSYRTSPDGVRERRAPVVTGAISAPILTQSSLNW